MLVIAIDGACRRNGKPDCVSAGGVFVVQDNETYRTLCVSEKGSTNQRGEMLALLEALRYIYDTPGNDALIITDSEYLFNAMSKEWFNSWIRNDWITSAGTPVKNADLWMLIVDAYAKCVHKNIDIIFFHIKGHVIPFGEVTATKLLQKDNSGEALFFEALHKYDESKESKADNIENAKALSIKNNGYVPECFMLRQFVAANVTADAIATKCVNEADIRS